MHRQRKYTADRQKESGLGGLAVIAGRRRRWSRSRWSIATSPTHLLFERLWGFPAFSSIVWMKTEENRSRVDRKIRKAIVDD